MRVYIHVYIYIYDYVCICVCIYIYISMCDLVWSLCMLGANGWLRHLCYRIYLRCTIYYILYTVQQIVYSII